MDHGTSKFLKKTSKMTAKTSPAPDMPIDNVDENTPSPSNTLFRKFTESTTLHGFGKVFGEGSKTRRLIWLLLLVCCTAIFFYTTGCLIHSYLTYDVITRYTLVNQDYATFPAVTICNFNQIRKEYIKKMNLTNVLGIDKYFSHSVPDWTHSQKANNSSVEDILRNGAHKMEYKHMLYYCIFRQRICGPKHFKPVFTSMGLCYTFNKDPINASFAKIGNPGEDFGLELFLGAEQKKYFGKVSFEAGFKVYIHNQDEPPLVKQHGFAVMPGTSTFVAVTKKQIKSQPAPYKPNCQNKKLPGTSIYSKSHCVEACRVAFITKKCGCRDANMPKIPNIRTCTFGEKINCVKRYEVDFIQTYSLNSCSCPKPCDLISYETRLSYAQFPSQNAKESLKRRVAKLYLRNNYSYQDAQKLLFDQGTDYVLLKIFFQDLNYHVVEDVPKHEVESLIAQAGGMLGLCLGASILTLIEVFDFLFSLFTTKWRK